MFLLPTPSIMLWSSVQIAEHMSMEDAADLQNFVELGLIPSTAQLFFTLGAIGIVSVLLAIYLYKERSE